MSKLGLTIHQKYSFPGGPEEFGPNVKYPMQSLSRYTKEELLAQKMRELAEQRKKTRLIQQYGGGLYADAL